MLDNPLRLTSPLSHGHRVKVVQALLHQNRWHHDFQPGRIDGRYGEASAKATKRAKYLLGFVKKNCNGEFNNDLMSLLLPLTDKHAKKLGPVRRLRRKHRLWKMNHTPWRKKAFSKAVSQLGVKESPEGSNRVKFTAWYGLTSPWCAMFVTWCYLMALPLRRRLTNRTFRKGSRYAYVPFILADARGHRNGLSVNHHPLQGDLVLYDWDRDGVPDHIGLFDHWINIGLSFYAVEGNTSAGNNSNGGQVQRRDRVLSDVIAFIRVDG